MTSYGNYKKAYNMEEEQSSDEKNIIFDIENHDNFNQILELFPIVVVDVWAQWCNPCKKIYPRYVELSKKYETYFHQKKIIFLKDDVDRDDSIHKNMVHVVPTFFIYINKKPMIISDLNNMDHIIREYIN